MKSDVTKGGYKLLIHALLQSINRTYGLFKVNLRLKTIALKK